MACTATSSASSCRPSTDRAGLLSQPPVVAALGHARGSRLRTRKSQSLGCRVQSLGASASLADSVSSSASKGSAFFVEELSTPRIRSANARKISGSPKISLSSVSGQLCAMRANLHAECHTNRVHQPCHRTRASERCPVFVTGTMPEASSECTRRARSQVPNEPVGGAAARLG